MVKKKKGKKASGDKKKQKKGAKKRGKKEAGKSNGKGKKKGKTKKKKGNKTPPSSSGSVGLGTLQQEEPREPTIVQEFRNGTGFLRNFSFARPESMLKMAKLHGITWQPRRYLPPLSEQATEPRLSKSGEISSLAAENEPGIEIGGGIDGGLHNLQDDQEEFNKKSFSWSDIQAATEVAHLRLRDVEAAAQGVWKREETRNEADVEEDVKVTELPSVIELPRKCQMRFRKEVHKLYHGVEGFRSLTAKTSSALELGWHYLPEGQDRLWQKRKKDPLHPLF